MLVLCTDTSLCPYNHDQGVLQDSEGSHSRPALQDNQRDEDNHHSQVGPNDCLQDKDGAQGHYYAGLQD